MSTTSTPATCQLATPARHGRDGRPYTTCQVRVNPAGYCSECGTLVAVPVDPGPGQQWTWVAACAEELRERVEGAPYTQHVASCERAPGHEGEHLARVIDPASNLATGELVEWPSHLAPTTCQECALEGHTGNHEEHGQGMVAELLASGATFQFEEGEEPQPSVREHHRAMLERRRLLLELAGEVSISPKLGEILAAADRRHEAGEFASWAQALRAVYSEAEGEPRLEGVEPPEDPHAAGAYEAYQRAIDEEEAEAYRSRFIVGERSYSVALAQYPQVGPSLLATVARMRLEAR